MALISTTVHLVRKGKEAYTRKWTFLALFVLFLGSSMGILAHFDLLPDAPKPASQVPSALLAASAIMATTTPVVPELPTTVSIPAIKLNVTVSNPETTDTEKLDETLLHGATRYPTTAELGQEGTMIIFGHSSYLPVVNNQAFKTFNGIQNLKAGDQILVKGSDTTYVYAVRTVVKADATQDGIPLSSTGHTLVLATCDSFGQKTDRFVVTSDLVTTYPNAS